MVLLVGSSQLTCHFLRQIGEHQPTCDDLIHPAYEWDEQALQSTNQRMEGLAINALLVQLYQPELLTTGPAAKLPSGQGFSAGNRDDTDAVRPQCRVWIGKDFRLDRTPRAPSGASRAGPTGAEATGTPSCIARKARAVGSSGFSPCMWG